MSNLDLSSEELPTFSFFSSSILDFQLEMIKYSL